MSYNSAWARSAGWAPPLWMHTPALMAQHLTRGRYQIPRHVGLISLAMRRAASKRDARIILTVPPRHGKSEQASHWFPLWYLAWRPDHRIILCSYAAEFASEWGRKVRNSCGEHGRTVGLSLSEDSKAADRWNTPQGGGMVATGVGGQITGRGADLLLIDDPIKDVAEAYSPTQRQKLWDWYTGTAYDRLEPGGSIVLIMQRWHPDDLVGRLLREQQSGGERWEVINLPALADANDPLGRKEGEALWPGRYNVARLEQIRRAVGLYVWSSKFQQRPVPREGGMFRREWFMVVDSRPLRYDRATRYWDLAATETAPGKDPDWTVGTKIGLLGVRGYVDDVRRIRGTPESVEKLIRQTAMLDGPEIPIRIEQESGASGKIVIDNYARMLPRFDVRGTPSTGDKATRAMPLAAAAERGDVWLVPGPWVDEWLTELAAFPNGEHDDQVDSASGAWSELMGDWGWEVDGVTYQAGAV